MSNQAWLPCVDLLYTIFVMVNILGVFVSDEDYEMI